MINIGHLHPALVHLPIGIILLACLFHFLQQRYSSGVITPSVIRICLAIGILSAIPVVVTGILQVWQSQFSLSAILLHLVFAILSILISVFIYFNYLKYINRQTLINNSAFVLLIICMVLTGHFGGSLTHGENYLTTFASTVENTKSDEFNDLKPSTHTVEIKQMKFNPEVVIVNPGDTILFINKDFLPHNAVESDAGRWASPKLLSKESWKLVVDAEANYHCSYHVVMKGQIKFAGHNENKKLNSGSGSILL